MIHIQMSSPIIILFVAKYLLINTMEITLGLMYLKKISGQEIIEIGEGAFLNNLIVEYVQLPDESLRTIQIRSELDFLGKMHLHYVV